VSVTTLEGEASLGLDPGHADGAVHESARVQSTIWCVAKFATAKIKRNNSKLSTEQRNQASALKSCDLTCETIERIK